MLFVSLQMMKIVQNSVAMGRMRTFMNTAPPAGLGWGSVSIAPSNVSRFLWYLCSSEHAGTFRELGTVVLTLVLCCTVILKVGAGQATA